MRHCPTCSCKPKARKPIAKVSRRERTRAVNGVQSLPGGREKCVTKEAWQKRREEVWERDGHRCQQGMAYGKAIRDSFGGMQICGRLVQLSEAEIHHMHKRSLGRDDRIPNLVTLCGGIFGHHRLYDSRPQWSKK